MTVWGLYSADVAMPSARVSHLIISIATALPLRLIFLYEFAKTEQTRLRKTVVVLHIHFGVSIKIKLKIITSLLLCCRASCQHLTLHHLGWRDGPKVKTMPRVGGESCQSLFQERERNLLNF